MMLLGIVGTPFVTCDSADGVPSLPATLFENMTGLSQVYNMDLTKAPAEFSAYGAFLDRPDVRHALHVGQAAFLSKGAAAREHMGADVMTSQRHRLAELLDQGVKVGGPALIASR